MKPVKCLLIGSLLVISGCSSPPEPPAVKWDKPLSPTTSQLPLWQENRVVTPSPVISGIWTLAITDFQDVGQIWPPDIWYAVVHSTQITVSAPDATTFFSAKNWLRQHGATGLIAYRPKIHCLTCNTTDLFFYR